MFIESAESHAVSHGWKSCGRRIMEKMKQKKERGLQCFDESGGSTAVLDSRFATIKNSSLSGFGPHCL